VRPLPGARSFFYFYFFFNFERERPPPRPVPVRENVIGASSARRNLFFFIFS
jgi:hypothetical protein